MTSAERFSATSPRQQETNVCVAGLILLGALSFVSAATVHNFVGPLKDWASLVLILIGALAYASAAYLWRDSE